MEHATRFGAAPHFAELYDSIASGNERLREIENRINTLESSYNDIEIQELVADKKSQITHELKRIEEEKQRQLKYIDNVEFVKKIEAAINSRKATIVSLEDEIKSLVDNIVEKSNLDKEKENINSKLNNLISQRLDFQGLDLLLAQTSKALSVAKQKENTALYASKPLPVTSGFKRNREVEGNTSSHRSNQPEPVEIEAKRRRRGDIPTRR